MKLNNCELLFFITFHYNLMVYEPLGALIMELNNQFKCDGMDVGDVIFSSRPSDVHNSVIKKKSAMSGFNSRSRLFWSLFGILLLISWSHGYELYANGHKSKFIYMEGDKCILYIDKRYASILLTYEYKVLPSTKFNRIFQRCFEEEYRNSLLKRAFIVPGTYWCGIGTIANDMEDFGSYEQVDACCKHHDLCPLSIKTSRCDYNICNSWIHTISHCDCDQMFLDCLIKLNSTGADIVGTLYFDLLHMNCFYEKEGSPKCPLINDGICKCKTNLKRLTYTRKNFISELPVVRSVKRKFMMYLHRFY